MSSRRLTSRMSTTTVIATTTTRPTLMACARISMIQTSPHEEANIRPKGKIVHAEKRNNSTKEVESYRVDLSYASSYDETIDET